MSAADKTDAARVELMLSELRLPGAKPLDDALSETSAGMTELLKP